MCVVKDNDCEESMLIQPRHGAVCQGVELENASKEQQIRSKKQLSECIATIWIDSLVESSKIFNHWPTRFCLAPKNAAQILTQPFAKFDEISRYVYNYLFHTIQNDDHVVLTILFSFTVLDRVLN